MKRILFLFVLLLAGVALSAQVTGLSDAYVMAGDAGFQSNVGQDLNITAGPISLALTADWARAVDGADTLAIGYTASFSKTFGAFTPGLKFCGDQTYALDSIAVQSGDYFSDLIPSLGIVLGKFGADLYSDLSFEKGYDLFQTFDGSVYFKAKTFVLRTGILYADAQAVTDDENYPNAPAIREGMSFYAKASISY